MARKLPERKYEHRPDGCAEARLGAMVCCEKEQSLIMRRYFSKEDSFWGNLTHFNDENQ